MTPSCLPQLVDTRIANKFCYTPQNKYIGNMNIMCSLLESCPQCNLVCRISDGVKKGSVTGIRFAV